MNKETEIWKTFKHAKDKKHPYASKWEVSNFGRIKRDGILVTPKKDSWGYLRISFACAHKLVPKYFIPKTEEDIQLGRDCVDHIDGNKMNNHVSNLRWCTHIENINFPLARRNQYLGAKKMDLKEDRLKNLFCNSMLVAILSPNIQVC
ncbi:MAG: HNH endonuclease [Allobaculum sp.]|nr:HNH endonuclease [Allobaculum sp.]